MTSISDTTQEFVKDQVVLESLEREIPEELVKEIFESLEELNWEPGEEDFEELQEKISDEEPEEPEEPQGEDILSSSSEELSGEDRGEFLDLPGPVEAALTLILSECLSPGNQRTLYTSRYACLSLLFTELHHRE